MIGTTLGHFQIERKLGAGGMGEVYLARDTKLGRDVALKLLPQTTPEKLARFEREARAVAGLAHPNIVVLHSIEHHEGQHFLVLELVEGRDLSELVAPGGLPLARVLELAIPLADALASAHERGIVHRDLKPANVKLARDGRVKVLDFGLARMLEGDLEQTMEAPLTGAGHVMGTVPYMAPEQLRGDAVDARADLFAFGVLLFELATGRRPFEGRTLADVSSAILRDPPAQADLPAELQPIVARSLAKDPRDRYPNAQELANDLGRIHTGKSARPGRPAGEVSIAVLPFANRSASADDEYFAEGLADELIGVLAQIRGLRVAARTSSGRFKDTKEELSAIGHKLNVVTLLEGSVRKAGNRVRINVQLVRAEDGDAVWSKIYDRTLDDVFAVQDDIAHSVVKELRKALLGEADDSEASREARMEVARAAESDRSENPEAQRLMLQARHIGARRSQEGIENAIALLDQAIDLDPNFARAYVERSRYHFAAHVAGGEDQVAHKARALADVERSLQLEPNLLEGHTFTTYLRFIGEMNPRAAAESLEKAVAIDPDHPSVLAMGAVMENWNGNFGESIRLQQGVVKTDPLNGLQFRNLALMLSAGGRHEEALEAMRSSLELTPHALMSHGQHSRILRRIGRLEEALAEAEREQDELFRFYASALVHDAAGRRIESDENLAKLIRIYGGDASMQIAQIYAQREDPDQAFAWLERGRREDSSVMESLSVPELVPLHADPRWAEHLRALGLGS